MCATTLKAQLGRKKRKLKGKLKEIVNRKAWGFSQSHKNITQCEEHRTEVELKKK